MQFKSNIPEDFDFKAMSEIQSQVGLIQEQAMKQVMQQREDALIKVLEDNGYTFESRLELIEFMKTRCQIAKFPNSKRILAVDGKQLVEWWETSRFERKGNKFVAIIGEAPDDPNHVRQVF